MVMYRPPANGEPGVEGEGKTVDLPPTYDSLFLGENPPGYNMLTVNLPSSSQRLVSQLFITYSESCRAVSTTALTS